eukprot:gnl/MRDRNA2_/MRDRNA2_337550_c0_seq1.p3 gnl/MRDRNA2_/MRDRNA2_337550_c0~~gnl/MRDRNA2_/MRDRNA2_337550_c0_seq1.p3  ORF type:complete len:109 (-),score=26.09 gnl/MRDRNA2_/MRDRNA2_337550_c0_seq1:153-479(-)
MIAFQLTTLNHSIINLFKKRCVFALITPKAARNATGQFDILEARRPPPSHCLGIDDLAKTSNDVYLETLQQTCFIRMFNGAGGLYKDAWQVRKAADKECNLFFLEKES